MADGMNPTHRGCDPRTGFFTDLQIVDSHVRRGCVYVTVANGSGRMWVCMANTLREIVR